MIKEQWLEIKKAKSYPMALLYDFWIKNKSAKYKDVSPEEFEALFHIYLQNGGKFSSSLINEYYDKQYNVTKFFDKKGLLTKEY